jgi:hypothetical protein
MFSTSFGGGFNAYAQRQTAVERGNKARQKSQRISDATKGKTKSRKPENKGKHRRQEAIIKGSGQAVQVAGLGGGGSASQNVVVLPAKAKNKPGAGRPIGAGRALGKGGGTGLDTAFKDRYAEKLERTQETERVRLRREAREDRVRQADVDEKRRDRGERQRQFNVEQARLDRQERARGAEIAQQVARDQAREVARDRERRDELQFRDQQEQARQAERRDELRIRDMEARSRLEIEERIARQQLRPLIEGPLIAGPLIGEGAIQFAPVITNTPQFENIGNPVVNVASDATSRRRERGRSRGGGGGSGFRRTPPSDDSSSSGGDDPDRPSPTPRTRRAQQGQSAVGRQRSGRTPSGVAGTPPSTIQQPTSPAEEASLLGGVASGLAIGAQTIGGGLARTAGGFVGGVGGAIAEQLPTAETIGDVAGRGAVAVAGGVASGLASGAQTLARVALRTTQEEQEADPSLLQSVSEGESVIVERQQPVKTLADRIRERQAEEQRELLEQQEEDERNRRIREERRRESQKRVEEKAGRGQQAGILADIAEGAGRVAGAVVGSLNLAREALSAGTLQQRESITTDLRSDEGFSSGGEEAGQVLVREGEEQGAFRETYVSPQDETDTQRRIRAQREQEEIEELERQTSRAPTPAQVQADVESGTEGIFRQFGRIVQTGGDVLEDPVEAPLSPATIQQQEDEASARRLQSKLDKPKTQRQQELAQRPVAILSGDRFFKPSTGKATTSKKVITDEYKKQGVEVIFTNDKEGVETSLRGEGRTIFPVRSPPPTRSVTTKKQAPQPEPETPPPTPPVPKTPSPPPSPPGQLDEDSEDFSEEEKDLQFKKLSPNQQKVAFERLQRQQRAVDKKLQEASAREAKKDKQIVSLSQRALLLDTEQSGGDESELEEVAEPTGLQRLLLQGRLNPERQQGGGSGSEQSSGDDYNLKRYGGNDDY